MGRRCGIGCASFLAAGVMFVGGAHAQAPRYQVHWLDAGGQCNWVIPLELDENGQGDVVGATSSPTWRAVFWPNGGQPVLIGPLGTTVQALNGNRQVVGCTPSGSVDQPFVWQNGQITLLEPSSWAEKSGCAYAI